MGDMPITRMRPNFAAVPYELVDDESISPQAKAVYMVLDRYADYNSGATFVGKGTIAKKCGYSKPDSIAPYLNELREKGWVSWHRRWKRDTGKRTDRNRIIYEYSGSPGDGFEPTTNLYVINDRVPVPPTAGAGAPPAAGQPIPPTAGTNENQVNENQVNENQERANAPVADATPPPIPKKSRKKPALPLPADWEPSERTVTAMTEECPNVDQASELLSFRDHWWSKDERRASWDATYRNWIRRAAKWAKPAPKQHSTASTNEYEDWFGRPANPQPQNQSNPEIFGGDVIDHQEIF